MSEPGTGSTWRKSSRSGGSGNCVELAVGPARTSLRDTKNRASGNLDLPADAFRAFVSATRADYDTNNQ